MRHESQEKKTREEEEEEGEAQLLIHGMKDVMQGNDSNESLASAKDRKRLKRENKKTVTNTNVPSGRITHHLICLLLK